jgi:O-antigen/teichoic acid export membrane protein
VKLSIGNALQRLLRPVVRNIVYLFLVQAATLLVPLVTLPWVLRALQPAAFGKFAFYQSIAQYFVIVVEFGFYLTATRRIAEIGSDIQARTSYFWTVQSAKAIIAVLTAILAAAAWLIFPLPEKDAPLFFASLVTIIGTVLTPMWLFAGIERMGLISISVIAARLAMIAPTLLYVRTPNDVWLAAIINSSGNILAGLIAISLVSRNRLISNWYKPKLQEIIEAYRDAWHLFLSNSATSLYAAANPVLLSAVNSTLQVGLFSAADRIRQISLGPISPLSSALYPYISRAMSDNRENALSLARRLLLMFGSLMGIVTLAMFLSAPLLVKIIMGPGYESAIPVLRIMALVPFLVGLNTCLGMLIMLPLGMMRQYSCLLLGCGFANLGLLALLGGWFGAIGAACALVFTETAVVVAMFVALYRHGVRLTH